MKASGMVGRTVFLVPLLLGAAPPPEPVSTWHVQRVNDGGTVKCRMESEKAPINDGYQKVTAQILVTAAGEVKVVSESTFDGGVPGEVGVQVDKNAFVKMDKLAGDKTVLFDAATNALLVQQFKAGLRARVQLRFWPTWPVTGSHDAEFSLIGFTKAYEEMTADCH